MALYKITHRASADDVPSVIECNEINVSEGGTVSFYRNGGVLLILAPQTYIAIEAVLNREEK